MLFRSALQDGLVSAFRRARNVAARRNAETRPSCRASAAVSGFPQVRSATAHSRSRCRATTPAAQSRSRLASPATATPAASISARRSSWGTRPRTITFADADSDDPDEQFTINGQFYDHDRIDTTVTLGATERWTLQNTSKELHVFHIHQTDFQVVEQDGVEVPFDGYQDTVNLPAATVDPATGQIGRAHV